MDSSTIGWIFVGIGIPVIIIGLWFTRCQILLVIEDRRQERVQRLQNELADATEIP